MKLQGSFDSHEPRSAVYAFLTDPHRLVQALPNVPASQVGEDSFVVHTGVDMGPFHGAEDVNVHVLAGEPGRTATYQAEGGGLGGSLKLHATFTLSDGPQGRGTHVDWSADAAIDGPLAPIMDGVLEVTAQRNVDHVVASMEQLISQQQSVP